VGELLEQREKEDQLGEALTYSYILYLRGGGANKNKDDANWNRILNLPFQIVQKPGGAAELARVLAGIGRLLGVEKLPMLDALARYYVQAGSDAVLAERFALEAEEVLDTLTDDQSGLRVESTCILALSYARQGRTAEAQDKSANCLSFAKNTHDEHTMTYSEAINSMVQAQTGNIVAAKSSLERLILKAPDNPELIVELAASMASAKLYNEADSQLDAAIKKFLLAGNQRTAAGAYERVAAILNSDSSNLAKKLQLEYLQRASKLHREFTTPQGFSWAYLTAAYSDRTSYLKDFDKAQECYRKAMELGYGKTLELDLMEIYLQTGKYAEAATIAKDQIQSCLKTKDTNCRAHALISLSEAERLRGNYKASRASLNEAGTLVTKSPDLYLRGRLEYQESRLLTSEGNLKAAVSSYKQVLSLVETIKEKLDSQEQKSLAENYGFIYDELVAVLYSMSKKTSDPQSQLASESLRYAETNKARQFAASWGRVFVSQMRQALPPATQEREQFLTSRRDGLLAQLEGPTDSGEILRGDKKEKVIANLSSVQGEIKQFVGSLRKTSPQYAAIAYPEEIQVSTIPLKKNETLVEFKMTENSTFAWVLQSKDGARNDLVRFYKIPKRRDWFLDRLSALRKGLNSGPLGVVDWKVSEELFAELFPDDVARIITESKELIFVPDDVLFILPFELLSPVASKGEFVFLKKATTYYPSAASLRLARTAAHQSVWQEAFLGIADPILARATVVQMRVLFA